MDNVNRLTTDIIDIIEEFIQLDNKQEDILWERIHEILEHAFGYPDYGNYN